MNKEDYIQSGILENYCMGLCTEEERAEVKGYAAIYPEIQNEIQQICTVFEKYVLSNKIQPSQKVKFAVMDTIYGQQAGPDTLYPPIIKENTSASDIKKWISRNPVAEPDIDFDNLFIQELPSTSHVTNFIVWAKSGHDTEIHTDINEYLYVIKGSCTMQFEDMAKDYFEGDIIFIPPHINHKAIVTSDFPMVALVQRRACA